MAKAASGCSSAQTQSSRSAIRSYRPLVISHRHSLWTRPSMNARPRRPKASHRTAYQRHPSPNSAEYLTSTRMRSRKQTSRCHRPRARHGLTPSTWCNKPTPPVLLFNFPTLLEYSHFAPNSNHTHIPPLVREPPTQNWRNRIFYCVIIETVVLFELSVSPIDCITSICSISHTHSPNRS